MVPLAALLGIVVGGLVTLLRPLLLFPALLVICPLFDFTMPLGPLAAHPNTLIVLALGVAMLPLHLQRRTLRVHLPLHGLSILIGFWILLGAGLQWGPNTTRRIMALAMMYLTFEVTLQSVRSVQDAVRLRQWIVLSSVLATVGAVLNRTAAFGGRAVGYFGNPNSLGMYLAGCLPLTLSLVLAQRPGPRRRLTMAAFAIAFYGLWISGSRGALVGALAGCALVTTRRLSRALLGALLLGSVFLGVTLIEESSHGLERVPNALEVAPVVFESSKIWLAVNGFSEATYAEPPWIEPRVLEDFPRTLGARMMIWYQAIMAGVHNPVLGIGPGNSNFSALPFDSKTFANCFNVVLAPWVEGGLPGFLLHLAWLAVIVGLLRRGMARDPPDRFALGVAGAFVAFLVHGMVEDTYFGIYANWLIGLILGAGVGYALSLPRAPRLVHTTGHLPPAPPGPEDPAGRYPNREPTP